MRAVVQDRYGSADVLRLDEIDKPVPRDDQVLVRVRASSVNAVDWHTMRADPFIVRGTEGLRRPKERVRGVDVAGEVESVGKDVTDLRPGDAVFGSTSQAFAEYIAGRTLVPKPASLSFDQAAAIPAAGCTALQAVRDKAQIRAGQRVLVTGAGGGVGTYAVQIAKALGADVTAVTRTDNVDVVRSIGADCVIDYTREDFTRSGDRYDAIVDVAGYAPLPRLVGLLTPQGRVVVVGVGSGHGLEPLTRVVAATVRSRLRGQRFVVFVSQPNRDDLFFLKELAEAGKLVSVIDRTYPLERVPEALRYVETGRARGKVVVTI